MQTKGQINTIYDLLLIPGLTASDISHLKTYIFIGLEHSGTLHSRLEENSYNYGSYLNEDGNLTFNQVIKLCGDNNKKRCLVFLDLFLKKLELHIREILYQFLI